MPEGSEFAGRWALLAAEINEWDVNFEFYYGNLDGAALAISRVGVPETPSSYLDFWEFYSFIRSWLIFIKNVYYLGKNNLNAPLSNAKC